MTITVLLTGFEPFNNANVNPAWEAVRALDGWSEGSFTVHGRQLPCVFGEANDVLRAAIADCEKSGDYVSREIFERILESEEEHIDWLETQLGLIKRIGLENYCQLQVDAS